MQEGCLALLWVFRAVDNTFTYFGVLVQTLAICVACQAQHALKALRALAQLARKTSRLRPVNIRY